MKKLFVICVLLLWASSGMAVTLPYTHDFNTISPWSQAGTNAAISTAQSAPASKSSSVMFTYSAGRAAGTAPDSVYTTFSSLTTVFTEYHYKYASNWDWHSGQNEQVYWKLGDPSNSVMFGINGSQKIYIKIRRADASTTTYTADVPGTLSLNPTIAAGTMYKVRVRITLNTPGVSDGVLEVYHGGSTGGYQTIIKKNTVMYRSTGVASQLSSFYITPTWGESAGESKHAEIDYMWVDYVKISTASMIPTGTPPPALLTGKWPGNYTLPPGWAKVLDQTFEAACPGTQDCGGINGARNTTRPHTGSYSLTGTYANDQSDFHWNLDTGTTGTFDEIYVSWWEWLDNNVSYPDADFAFIRFYATYGTTPTEQANNVILTFLDWIWPKDAAGLTAYQANAVKGSLFLLSEYRNTNGLGGGFATTPDALNGKTAVYPNGQWRQWEVRYKPSKNFWMTSYVVPPSGVKDYPAGGDGNLWVYVDGNLFWSMTDKNINGSLPLTNTSIMVAGIVTKSVWMTNSPTCTQCSSRPGIGSDYCTSTFRNKTPAVINSFSNPVCSPSRGPGLGLLGPYNDLPVTTFTKSVDDIIVLKKTACAAGVDCSPPYVPSIGQAGAPVPARGATGILLTDKTVTLSIKDDQVYDVGVIRSEIVMTVEGVPVTPTITPSGSTGTSYSLSYTSPINWTNGQVVDITVYAEDVSGNVMSTGWSFTAATTPDPLTITTTTMPTVKAGTSLPVTLAATGGTNQYTWSVSSGSMPQNRTITAATGVISGTYMTAGTYNFTAMVTDANSATDTQALTQIVTPGDPIDIGLKVEDTWINGGSATTNYSDNTALKVYDWPDYTPINKIIVVDNTDILGLPDNVCVTDAKLKLYLTGYDWSGGSSNMRIYAYKINGTHNPSTITWNTFTDTTTLLSYTDVGLDNGWVSWNVTNAVQSAYTARSPVYLLLDGGASNVSNSNRTFASYEYADESKTPLLVITYNQRIGPTCDQPKISAPGRMRVTKFKGTLK